jgi:uncharacterized protein
MMVEFDSNLNPIQPAPSQPAWQTPPQMPPTPPTTPTPMPVRSGGNNPWGIGLIAILVIAVIAIAGMYFAKPSNNNSGMMEGITVSADSQIYAQPDLARVTVAIQKNGKTVTEVETALSDVITPLKAALKELGIEDKDIKTQDYNIYPQTTYPQTTMYPNGGTGTSRITGYTGRHALEITIHNIDKSDTAAALIDKVIEAGTKAGANEVGNVSFGLEDEDAKLAEARKDAIAKAKDKAKQMASDSGFRLGRLVSVSEYSNPISPVPYYGAGMGGVTKDVATSEAGVEPGSLSLQVSVTLTYKIR